MTRLSIAFVFAILFTLSYGTHAQMMQTLNDADKLKANELGFRNKPLKSLLPEIGPEVKMVFADGNGFSERLSYFIFRFVDFKEYNLYKSKGMTPISIRVRVKENFEWDKPKGNVEDYFKWTKEDAEKYGNLTIAYFTVYGEACIVEGKAY